MSWPSMTIVCHPKARPAPRELLEVMAPHRGAALAEAVDVGDGAQAVEAVHGGDVSGLPDRAFRRLSVAEDAISAVVGRDPPRVERDADRGTDALTERAGRHVDKRQAWRRVPFEVRSELAQLQQLRAIERAGFGPRGVEQRRGVALRQHEAVAARMVRVFRIETHLGKKQRRHQIGGGAAAGRMPAGRCRGRPHRVDAKTRRDVLQGRNENGAVQGTSQAISEWRRASWHQRAIRDRSRHRAPLSKPLDEQGTRPCIQE